MSWVTFIYGMIASACLTMAAVHLVVWCMNRAALANLFFSMTAIATAAIAGFELAGMRAATAHEYGMYLRWAHIPYLVLVISLVFFVRQYLRAGRPWLAWTICVMRSFSLLLNFLVGENLNYRELTGLRHIWFLGDSVAVGVGIPNPCMIIGQVSLVLLVIFAADATLAVWRRGERRSLVLLGCAIVFFIVTGMSEFVLTFWGIIQLPLTPSLFFLGIIVAMGYEMTRETLLAAQAVSELRESEERMTLASQAAGFGVWIWNMRSNSVWATSHWYKLFGFTPADGITFEKVIQKIHPDDRDIVERTLRLAAKNWSGYEAEYRLQLTDGALRWISSRGRVYPAGNGRPARLMGASTDITEHKMSEQELTQQRSELAHLSRVTTLSELSGSLAHELNQPLAIILTNAQAAQRLLAQEPPDLAEARDILADIVSEDVRAGDVIRRLRALLKPGQACLLSVSINEIIEDVLRIARSDLIGRGVAVDTELTENMPTVLGDRIQLQQVLLNLILNAGDAMAANAPDRRQLTLVTKRHEGVIRISVSDTGCGLPSDVDRIFVPFYTTKKDGLGLGLAICRSIVTAHGGRLWAERGSANASGAVTSANCGATIHMELPVSQEGPI